MAREIADDLEAILRAMARLYAMQGETRHVALLTESTATIEQTEYHEDEFGVENYGYTIYLESPDMLYHQLRDQVQKMELSFRERAQEVTRGYRHQWVQAFVISAELSVVEEWRENARTFLAGDGLTNQGRARSDNIAPLMCDGLLFRSQPEINLYRAFKALGVTFAPLPVFIRGGETYRRIEPDFVLFKDGFLMIVEVDGSTIHQETPVDAHNRTTLLVHEGAHVERVNAAECETPETAKACATRLLEILKKLRASR